MALTVNNAFDTFLSDFVRLSSTRSELAKTSKNNLIKEIEKFPNDGEFPLLYPGQSSIDYGSFSRKTKIRPLDDIDLMIILHAEGNYRRIYNDGYQIIVDDTASKQLKLCNDGTNVLNSRKVINKFKNYLWQVSYYENADIKLNHEATTLKLKSYEWVYDIVPCFKTTADSHGGTFFLIPDGNGNWKPTDPRIDKERTTRINSGQTISVLDVIRIMKYWTRRPTMPTMKSYFLENLILAYYDSGVDSSKFIDLEIPKVLVYIYNNVNNSLLDPKGFQGDINHLTYEERMSIRDRASLDYEKSVLARQFESEGKHKESIQKWGEIFGGEFPTYF